MDDRLQGPKVLVVEDSPTQARRLALLLEERGYRVTVAGDATAALDQIRQDRPSLVISDVMMPGMDGYGLCRAIKDEPKLRELPVILVTYLSETADVIRGLAAGADNFILKPYEEETLLARVERTLRVCCRPDEPPEDMPLELGGVSLTVRSSRSRIIEILLSTYDTAVERNRRLKEAMDQLSLANDELNTRIQERTAALHQLQETNQELEAFAYSVSHDLRTPLAGIIGLSRLQLSEPPASPKCREYAELIQTSGERMTEIVDDLLKLSRASRTEIRRSPVDVTAMVRGLLGDLERQAPERKVRFDVQEGMTASADEGLLRICFDNLLRNAWKFTADQDPALIEVGLTAGAKRIFWVRDNGIGFEMAQHEDLFKTFHRLPNASGFPGAGIGLGTVRRVVNRHGGRIWAEGEPGKGATFRFTLGEEG